MISKELMSEITGIPDNSIKSISIGKSIISVRKINGRVEEYNVYELENECKKLAWINGYRIVDYGEDLKVYNMNNECKFLVEMYEIDNFNPIRTFKACQWILENKDKRW